MLKDLRNEESNNVIEEKKEDEKDDQTGENENNESMILSISEIDILRQQLSSCWNAPAGAVINIGDKVTISAKVQQNMKVYQILFVLLTQIYLKVIHSIHQSQIVL